MSFSLSLGLKPPTPTPDYPRTPPRGRRTGGSEDGPLPRSTPSFLHPERPASALDPDRDSARRPCLALLPLFAPALKRWRLGPPVPVYTSPPLRGEGGSNPRDPDPTLPDSDHGSQDVVTD